MRRRPGQPMDIELVLYALLAAVDVLSGALAAVLAMVSLYWLALAKLQARGVGGSGRGRRGCAGWGGDCACACRGEAIAGSRHGPCGCLLYLGWRSHLCPARHPHSFSSTSPKPWRRLLLGGAQEQVHLLVPPDSGMYNFWVTMVLAVVGQSVGLLWTLYRQVK